MELKVTNSLFVLEHVAIDGVGAEQKYIAVIRHYAINLFAETSRESGDR